MSLHRLSSSLLSGLLLCALGACGAPATVRLELTDAPPDTENMSRVMVTLQRLEVQLLDNAASGEERTDAWMDVALENREFDLLALQNDVTASLGELHVTDGKITQLRLHIDPRGRNEVVMRTGMVCALDLRDVDPAGTTISPPFQALEIQEGQAIRAVIDFDLQESVQRDGDCQYRLTPVIKLKRTTQER